ncbi:unnamed protein product [Eruca vesicaria subsp. sativa]|uniref:Uncharacterized protein n=1 Tax=Eruca vesicaria subsp. sativa TaxID=29727 RepID=A0ABC8LLY6_ERUVS|nr:unnamed protein product [Eruca vesicaria subsp. sativa]
METGQPKDPTKARSYCTMHLNSRLVSYEERRIHTPITMAIYRGIYFLGIGNKDDEWERREYGRENSNLRVDSRRRSLTFGQKPKEAQLVWKEKVNPSEEGPVNTPFTTPRQIPEIQSKEVQLLHETIMTDLQNVTQKYVNVPDPVESAARRQRVLEGEANDLMARTAATMLENALTKGNQLTSNHAFYAELEKSGESLPQNERQEIQESPALEPQLGVLDLQHHQSQQPKKRGRPPGRTTTNPRRTQLAGAGSKKRKVVIQNSPHQRRSYSTLNNLEVSPR